MNEGWSDDGGGKGAPEDDDDVALVDFSSEA